MRACDRIRGCRDRACIARLDHQPFLYVWLDATYLHVREHGQVVSRAVMIATDVRADGHREVLGVDIGNSENETFWTLFLRDLVDHGLGGVKLVISDAHAGLVAAIRRVVQGAAWQCCRVHARHGWPDRFAANVHTALAPRQLAAKPYLVTAKTDTIRLAAAQLLLIHDQRRVWEKQMAAARRPTDRQSQTARR